MAAERRPAVRLRPVRRADAERLLEWRNDPEVREASLSQEPISMETHWRWFAAKSADPNTELLIVELGGRPVGQVRLERVDDRTVEVHVALAAPARGRGLGPQALELAADLARAELGASELVARIRADNPRSLSAFAAAGFTVRESGDDVVLVGRQF